MLTASAIVSGCSATEQLELTRPLDAPVALDGVRRLGVAAFSGEGGEAVARRLLARLQGPGERAFSAAWIDGAASDALELARTHGLDAVLVGSVERVPAADPPAGLVRVRTRLMRPEGEAAWGPDATVPVLQEPAAAWARAADEVGDALLPRARGATITWERADGLDEPARELLEQGDVAGARAALARAIATSAGEAAPVQAALHYDLGLCLELAGLVAEAEHSYDEALTLHGSELHIEALRRLRARSAGGAR